MRPNRIHVLEPNADSRKPWREQVVTYPANKYGTAKAARAAAVKAGAEARGDEIEATQPYFRGKWVVPMFQYAAAPSTLL